MCPVLSISVPVTGGPTGHDQYAERRTPRLRSQYGPPVQEQQIESQYRNRYHMGEMFVSQCNGNELQERRPKGRAHTKEYQKGKDIAVNMATRQRVAQQPMVKESCRPSRMMFQADFALARPRLSPGCVDVVGLHQGVQRMRPRRKRFSSQ